MGFHFAPPPSFRPFFGHGHHKGWDWDDWFDHAGFCFGGRHDDSHNNLPPTQLNGTLDVSGTDGHGHALFGSGNPATGYQIQHNGTAGFEGALSIVYRQGDTIKPYAVDSHGVLQFYVPEGTQVADPAHHVPSANAGRAAWSFNFEANALSSHTLGEFDIHLKVDVDPSAAVHNLDFHLVKAPTGYTGSSSGYVWENSATHQIVIGDDGGVLNHVSENSENFAFNFIKSAIDADPHTPGMQPYNFTAGIFDIELTADKITTAPTTCWSGPPILPSLLPTHTTVEHVVDIHTQVHVVPTTDFHLVA